MRVLVTGLTGFVGGHLAEHLLDAGDQVCGWSARGCWPPDLGHLARSARLDRVDLTSTPIDDLAGRIAEARPDAIYHLAAWAHPSRSRAEPASTWATNLGGTLRLLEGVRLSGLGPRILVVGTGLCYAAPAGGLSIDESSPLTDDTPYATSKAAADRLALEHRRAHYTWVIVARPMQHTGPRQRQYAVSEWAQQVARIERGATAELEHGELSILRDYTDVRDVVRAYRLLIERGTPGEVYNVGSGRETRIGDLLDRLKALARVPVPTRLNERFIRPNDPPRLVLNTKKLREATGWEPQYPIDRTLADLLDFWRDELNGTS